jgi:hypothetical protein
MSENLQQHKILDGVPRIGFDVHMCPFPGSLYACLEYLDDPFDYNYLMGVTGAAFRRFWNRDDGGNIDLSYLGDEPFRRAFEALGYDWRKIRADKDALFRAVVESIDRGVPVISFGILGPPEAGLVIGYDRDGQALSGWSYFQDWPEHGEKRDAPYKRHDWFGTMNRDAGKDLIVIGSKLPSRPAPRNVLVASLEWAIRLERTARWPGCPGHVTGLAAYDAWADALEVDADYPPDNAEVLGVRLMVYGDQCTMLYERHSAAKYLRQMAAANSSFAVAPEVADRLNAATALYDEAAAQGEKLWPWGYEMGPEAQRGLSKAQARREFAAYVRAARVKEAEAVVHLERALAALR